ncbi:MAG: type II secretion system protein [Janthinobacterium lividum]
MNLRTIHKGFTLIELLVVVTIIGLLAALLFPVFAAARHRAGAAACVSNLRQIGLATQMYEEEADGKMPPHNPNWWSQPSYNPLKIDPSLYSCPETGETIIYPDYEFRFQLVVQRVKPYNPLPDDPNHVRVLPAPNTVLAYCYRHLTPNNLILSGQPQDGFYQVLRNSGAVERIPWVQVHVWECQDKNGLLTWFPPDGISPPSVGTHFAVFPNEPWPPQFEN